MEYKNANWNKIWSRNNFKPKALNDWAAEIFINIFMLLKDVENPYILSAGCGRGLIDYWLINVFGYKIILLDNSLECIKKLKKTFKKIDKNKFNLCQASILNIPYPDNSFDLVWNEGTLEHFQKHEYNKALQEICRVSKKYILIDIPYAKSKPYIIVKKYLENHNLWFWGYEMPRTSLKDDLEINGIKIIKEIPIGSIQTNMNYINMIPSHERGKILSLLTQDDFEVPPHLMVIGQKE